MGSLSYNTQTRTNTYGGHLWVAYHLRPFDSWCALICVVLSPAFEVKIPVTFASLSFTLAPHAHKQTTNEHHLLSLSD